ncbi:lipopolysaccharide biosynthesis protein [Bacillus sp. MRMR6]|uniref:lipopolysaccharide biosynthesis protein n=1 Tax=Bacillus sp. MRMR6 TaxID=1928617 RepID=UPI00095358D6|nr:oligosaccharide flippase family protein [Bacillus sp. MRMR6]OLS41091.1 hypothetical protein BTR25_04280 [Bacillus sp. MRMR6]
MRTKNSLINTVYAIFGQALTILFSFVNRTVFIYVLGAEYLGINGLFTDLLYMLSLAELGVSTAITFALYKPLLENDIKKISSIMNLFSRLYKTIGCIVAIIGLCLTPFLELLIKGNTNISNLETIYLLFLTNSAISYFFTFKRTLIIADQKQYINTKNIYTFQLIQYSLQAVFLLLTKNYFLFLIIQIVCTVLSNIVISIKVDRLYPYLKENKKERIDKSSKQDIYKNVGAMFFHKIGSVIVSGTDNLLLASFVGITSVGVYSNYKLIISILTSFINQIFNSVTASVGNLSASESDKQHSYFVYSTLNLISFWIFGICVCVLFSLLNPFINFWIGESYLLDLRTVFLIIILFYITGMRQTNIVYINAMGLFWPLRYKSLIEALLNLLSSLFFLKYIGMPGIFLGTIFSTMLTNFWWEPYVVHKVGFKVSIMEYLKNYLKYALLVSFTCLLTFYINSFILVYGIFGIIIKTLISFCIPNIVYLIIFFKTKEFKYLFNILNSVFLKKFRNE